ncbi:MAG: YceI family protein [Nevskia sp.]|nr:YceI family protein [Nevskia sp.]
MFVLDPATSRVRIFVYRGGAAARAGHNHVLSAPDFTGYAYVPEGDLKDARFDLDFALERLAVDPPAIRAGAGPAFASVLDDAARSGTRAHMLGPKNLDAARFPEVLIHGQAIAGEWPHLVASLSMTLHGVSRPLLVPLEAQLHGRALAVSGRFAIRQSDFGASPYTALGGLIAVRDEVYVEFELLGREAAFDRTP